MNRTMRRLRGRIQRWRFLAPAYPAMLVSVHARGVDPAIVLETWDAVADGTHNSNTDLTFFDGWFYLCHQTSPYHLGSRRSRLLLWRSRDARAWEMVREFKNETGREYRDPKFAVIGARLFLYMLPNLTMLALPVTTVFTSAADGVRWDDVKEIDPAGWLFWRPKTRDGQTWYVTAYWNKHGRSALLKSPDGADWSMVSQVYEGEGNDETDFEFLPDGRILATARLERNTDTAWGDRSASTLLAISEPPYMDWSYHKSQVTRFDGPCLFPYGGRVYGIARYQATRAPKIAELGGMYSRKRTSLFAVEEDRLLYLTDLPSAGDTSYAGIVIRGDDLYASYYTTPPERDVPWALGMFGRTDIRMARISLRALEASATAQAEVDRGG